MRKPVSHSPPTTHYHLECEDGFDPVVSGAEPSAAHASGGEAAAALNGEAVNAMSDYPVAESGDIEGSDATSAGELQTNPSQSRNAPPAQAVSVPPAEKSIAPASPNASASSSVTPLDEIYRMLDQMKIDRELFDKYAQKKWGSWKANAKGVEKVMGDVTASRNDPDAYLKKIDSEVNVFS